MTSGIPQGSVLGPVLFIIYINDMPDKVTSMCKLFADDSKLYLTIKSRYDQEIIQSDLFKLCDWSKEWLLAFNIAKCKAVHYGYTYFDFNYQMKDSTGEVKDLPYDTEEKDLGIKFHSSLKFDSHISTVVNKANQIIGLIKRSFYFMDKSLFLKLYKTLVRPHFDYGNSIWYPISKKNIQSIENVQRRATRIVPELKNLTYEERLCELEYRRKRGDLIHMFKIIHGIDDISCEKFVSFNENTTRGHSFKLNKPRCLKSLRLNAFPARCIENWNSLPDELVRTEKLDTFKNRLDVLWRGCRFDVSNIY